ncbi:RluA family pseudouridine synthase [Clostridium folliculivorans]|uniref:Pseudouridine synthase n=1 Tax=Clostridium folliculivorans TaxID=2886038 RepID=A0A9W5XYR9_9CLOT|nr:RluA family pseudouridine synthase [Clostridium folliculivorans]GKU23410.1 pseudouridine synthase [Clostridium folliculivorans]GKU29527.1 pseudouridine synthase [Clostridium folliculivorans]
MSYIREVVPKEYEGRKIRDFLKEKLGLSTRLVRGAAIDGRIKANNIVVKMNYVLKFNDNIEVNVSKNESQNIEPEKMNLKIVYEDEDIIVINKDPFMVVHPTKSHQSGTLANGVINYFNETNQNCIVRLVSRLDMNTSGLIIIAKNQYAHMALSKQNAMDKDKEGNIKGHSRDTIEIEKRYIAVVHGNLESTEGTLDLPIHRPGPESIKRIVDEQGQRSITHYKVIERLNGADVVECSLETGRTHQIRVHLSHIGHPIFGDTLYGSEDDEEYIKRQALHAYRLDFQSPRSKKSLSLRADLPEDMKKLIDSMSIKDNDK